MLRSCHAIELAGSHQLIDGLADWLVMEPEGSGAVGPRAS